MGDGVEPDLVQFRIIGDAVRGDVFRHRFIDVALRQLRVAEPGPMADEFVRTGSADAGEEKIPHRMFEHRAMAHLEDVLEIRLVAAGPGLGEGHIAHPARRLPPDIRRPLRCRSASGRRDRPGIAPVPASSTVLPAHKINGRFADNVNAVGIESHGIILKARVRLGVLYDSWGIV